MNKSPKIILLNAPPRAGKDTAAAQLMLRQDDFRKLGYEPSVYKFALPLKNATHALFGLDCPPDAFEKSKDIVSPVFMGLSPRQAYIKVSEEMVKPVIGIDFFGQIACNVLRDLSLIGKDGRNLCFIISDCGFATEVFPLMAEFDEENILVVHIHRENCDFKNDSRDWLFPPNTRCVAIENNKTVKDLGDTVWKEVSKFLTRS